MVFTDEKCLRNFSNSKVRVWRERGTALDEENVITNPNKRRISINLWGYIAPEGFGRIFWAPKKMKSIDYMQILYDFLNDYDMTGKVLMQDNASIHGTALIKQLMKEERLNVLKWPARSPDLNPIENCWSLMQRMVDKEALKRGGINSEAELFDVAQQSFSKISNQTISNLYSSMKDRLTEVQFRKGGIVR